MPFHLLTEALADLTRGGVGGSYTLLYCNIFSELRFDLKTKKTFLIKSDLVDKCNKT